MADPFAPPKADLTFDNVDSAAGARLDPAAWPRFRTKIVLLQLRRLPLVALMLYFVGPLPARVIYITIAVFTLATAFGIWRNLRQQARLWTQLRYRVDDDGVAVSGAPERTVTIPKPDIRSVRQNWLGLTVRGPELGQVVLIPEAVEGYDEFRQRLIEWERFDPGASFLVRYGPSLINAALAVVLLTVLISRSPWVIAFGSPFVIIFCLVRLYRLLTSSAVPARTKIVWTLILGYVAFATGLRFYLAFGLQ